MSDGIFEPPILFRPQIAGRPRQGDPTCVPSLRSPFSTGVRTSAKVPGGRVSSTAAVFAEAAS